jgi:hypothetical protein
MSFIHIMPTLILRIWEGFMRIIGLIAIFLIIIGCASKHRDRDGFNDYYSRQYLSNPDNPKPESLVPYGIWGSADGVWSDESIVKIPEITLSKQDKVTPTTANIKGAARITGAIEGQKVTAYLFSLTPDFKPLDTLTRDIPKNSGNLIFVFAFKKPTNGWQQGNYKVVVESSAGATNSMTFQVK